MRVGIIGLGNVSVMHINALINKGENIVSLCDIEKEKCTLAKEKYNLNCNIYENYIDMIENENLDSVHICTPHYLHCEMVCACLDRNINVLCEKPLCISYEQLDVIEKSVKSSSGKLGVCFQNRYLETVKFAKDFFKDKKITSGCASCFWMRDKAYYDSGAWRGKKATEGGGVMINQAIHSLDLLQYICGMPDKVTAYISNISLKDVIEVEDTAFGRFTFDGGNFIICATNSASYTYSNKYMFHSDDDTLEIIENNVLINGKPYLNKGYEFNHGKKAWGYGHEILISEFYDCLKTEKHFPIDFDEGSKAIKLVLAMYNSSGKEIKI